ncbi:sensor histidine kinase [Agrococcus sp. Marseille-P2731]|uniref:sensor histidine kinase n=1 Tax=Agrococcus sp. Marseille-P2731 TaxID=1841862 RepID=UPI000931DEDE|nr:histidine kinase [Agrococcus sp. Marseille-P2731]
MILTEAVRLALRWSPTLIAACFLGSLVLSMQIDGLAGLFVTLLILGGFAVLPWWPRAAFAAVLLGIWSASPTEPAHSGLLFALGFGAAALIAWRVEPLRLRLLSGLPLGLVAALALTWRSTVQVSEQGWGQTDVSTVAGPWLLAMLAWAAVVGARGLRDALRAESAKQQAVARTTVVESELRDERLRADLTHDFHDVMAHSLAVLAAQAEGLRLSHAAHPERIDPVLTTISDTARLALVEVRQLLERVDDDARRPQATSTDIPSLVAQVRSAGPTVTLLDVGEHGRLPRLGDIAAYRIVQESLTNALRHGGSDIDIVVSLTWTGPGLSLAVSSPIADRAALQPAGRGIAGMHERARLAGGSLEISADGDRFLVSGHLPYAADAEAGEPEFRKVSEAPTPPLTESQLFTLPVATQPRPEDVVAPWIVARWSAEAETPSGLRPDPSADPRPERRIAAAAPPPVGWSLASTVDLGPALPPDGRIRNPMAPGAGPQ